MTEQWQELKETITEMRDNDGTSTQQEVCKFLANYMEILEKQMQQLTDAKETIIKSALKGLVKMQIEEGSVGFAVDNDPDHDVCWDDVLAWLEAQPKKGHWISHIEHCENLGAKPSGLGAYEWCSNCDCGIDTMEFHRNHYNFCPNCGAEMSGGEEDEQGT